MIQIKRNNLDELANKHCQELIGNIKAEIVEVRHKMLLFWDKFDDDTIQILLKGKKDGLIKVMSEIDVLVKNNFNDAEKKALFDDVKKVFDYKSFTVKSPDKYNAYDLVESLNVDTCPYCNRQSTHKSTLFHMRRINSDYQPPKVSCFQDDRSSRFQG